MKKLFAMAAAVIILLSVLPTAGAAVPGVTPSPEGVTAEITDSDILYSVSFQAEEARLYEEGRQAAYEKLSADYTDEQIALSDSSWVLYPLEIRCGVTVNGSRVYPIKYADASRDSLSFTLFEDILPCLVKNDAYGENERGGFEFALTLDLVVNIDGSRQTSDAFGRAELGVFSAPATAYIDYDIPFEADNSGNPVFLFHPTKEDIVLKLPTRPGYTFTGWINERGLAVDRVPAGTQYARIGSCWQTKTFRVRYVMTTRTGYDFIKCINDNPPTFSSDEGLTLVPARAPSGWVFSGWYKEADFSGKAVTSIPQGSSADVILYAKWQTEEEILLAKIAAAHWGDLDTDGRITAADARLALRGSVGLEIFAPEIIARADFAGQGRLSADAARTLLRIAVGLDDLREILKCYKLI